MQKSSRAKTGLALSLLVALTIIFAALFLFNWQTESKEDLKPANQQASNACAINDSIETRNIATHDQLLRVEVVKNEKDKIQGLSGRDCLNESSGMLFVYEVEDEYCFWMKDMKFNIDIVWLNKNQEIIDIKSQASPDSYPQSFCPQSPANYILEVEGGLAEKLGWQIGSSFKL